SRDLDLGPAWLRQAPEKLVHTLRRLTLELRGDVAVAVQCERDLRVAQRLHDDPRRDTLQQHQGGAAMAEVVEPLCRQVQGLERSLVGMVEVAGIDGGAAWRREDELGLDAEW